MQRVEGVEKLLLTPLSLGEKLDVIDHQNIYMAVAVPKLMQRASFDSLDEVVDERFTGYVKAVRGTWSLANGATDGL